MAQVSVAEAKAKFSALLERAVNGEEVEITRRGKPVARLVASPPAQRPPLDIEAIRRVAEAIQRPIKDEDWMQKERAKYRY